MSINLSTKGTGQGEFSHTSFSGTYRIIYEPAKVEFRIDGTKFSVALGQEIGAISARNGSKELHNHLVKLLEARFKLRKNGEPLLLDLRGYYAYIDPTDTPWIDRNHYNYNFYCFNRDTGAPLSDNYSVVSRFNEMVLPSKVYQHRLKQELARLEYQLLLAREKERVLEADAAGTKLASSDTAKILAQIKNTHELLEKLAQISK